MKQKKKRKEYIELASIVGPDGKNKFQKSAEKTVQTKIERGQYTPFEQKNEFAQYTLLARYFSERNDLSQLKNFNKRGRAGTAGAYHLDHIYSIFDGFNNNVSPEIIGHINNLRFIPWKENVSKHQSSDCTLKELFENTNMEYVKYYAENYTEILKPRKSAEIMNSKKKFCEHCQRTINLGNYSRWHGDKCKQK